MSEWQPIATAPLDGSQFLVSDPTGGFAVCWYAAKEVFGPQPTSIQEAILCANGVACGVISYLKPTEWRPLPPGP